MHTLALLCAWAFQLCAHAACLHGLCGMHWMGERAVHGALRYQGLQLECIFRGVGLHVFELGTLAMGCWSARNTASLLQWVLDEPKGPTGRGLALCTWPFARASARGGCAVNPLAQPHGLYESRSQSSLLQETLCCSCVL